MPQNSLYNTLRSWALKNLNRYPVDKPMRQQEVALIVDDLNTLMKRIQAVQDNIILPTKKGQIITHNGTNVVLKDVEPTGRIAYTDSANAEAWLWADKSVLGFMTALLVKLNGTDVGSRTAISFNDTSDITFAVTDDVPNTRINIAASSTYKRSLVRKSADTTTASTTLADIADMNFAIAANETLQFTATLKIGCSAANGARYAITVPAGATLFAYYMGMNTTAIGQGVPSWLTVSGTEGSTTNALINANQITIIKGYVVNGSTAGTVNMQGRTANVANTVTYFQNSWIEVHN